MRGRQCSYLGVPKRSKNTNQQMRTSQPFISHRRPPVSVSSTWLRSEDEKGGRLAEGRPRPILREISRALLTQRGALGSLVRLPLPP